VTLVRLRDERLSIAVEKCLNATTRRQRRFVFGAQPSHLEDVVWTNTDAVLFALAAIAIDHWHELPSIFARCGHDIVRSGH
jgi:hypothetical protein